jgi:hypothetical protein
MLLASRLQVMIHKVWQKPLVRSRYMHYKFVMGAESQCKNRDKPINFIVRVSGWHDF